MCVLDFGRKKIAAFMKQRLVSEAVIEAWLFCSAPAGTSTAWSDLDVLVVREAD